MLKLARLALLLVVVVGCPPDEPFPEPPDPDPWQAPCENAPHQERCPGAHLASGPWRGR